MSTDVPAHDANRDLGARAAAASDRAIARLKASGLAFRIHEHPPVLTMQDVADVLPFPREAVLKTLVFTGPEGDMVVAVVRGSDRIDYAALAAAMGKRREEVRLAQTDDIAARIGFEPGGLGPVTPSEIDVVLDENVAILGTVFCGIGVTHRTLEMDVRDIASLTAARIARICRPQ